jgi:hypothetical protein
VAAHAAAAGINKAVGSNDAAGHHNPAFPAAMSADMRGNTDETWLRALDWLVHNRLLAPGYGLQH